MNWFTSILKTFGPRLIGTAVAAGAGLVYAKTHGSIQIDTAQATELVTGMLVTYAGAHRAASAVINPGDAAKGRVADGIKTAADDPQASDTVIIPAK